MRLTRRHFLTAATALVPARLWAGTRLDLGGGIQLDTLSDGHLELPDSMLLAGLPEADRPAFRAAHDLGSGPMQSPCNLTLLRDGARVVLFDAGAGPDFQATAGRLDQALAALDLTPEDVTDVIFTHGHPDHLWGVLDGFDDPLFLNARHQMGATEHAYWTDPATVDSIDPGRTTFAVGAARRLETLGDMVDLFDPETEVLPGITARATYGHTPGHIAFDIADGPLLVGDAIGNGHIAFEQPQAISGTDQDPETGRETRARLLADLAASGRVMVGFHLPEGGIGRVETAGAAYRFVPEG
ncbi:MBL fold metallo-hydrolase [Frigidibacter sp. ROC022]|uniref:MBL fold metallo-hydrolase n=1 Tax=Frigidibacter sp. ROC022 TaxID=2971796 RepID=UPI00215A574B|nr:MBL fold metallo-hydrolase [Frigidibacter sp. ROC022]MCR8726196.1 MBL fold metallo-hydrolase [Frigidibacter sp. ROC022]